MSTNDAQRIARDLGNLTSNDYDETGGGKLAMAKMVQRARLYFPVLPADGAANTTVAATTLYSLVPKRAGRVIQAGIMPLSNVTAHDTNYKVLSIHDAAGNVLATANTTTTGTGNLTAKTVKTFDGSATPTFDADEGLFVVVAIAASGVQMPASLYFIDVEWSSV